MHEAIRTHGRPDAGQGRERDDVVLHDHVRGELVEDLEQSRMDVLRAVDQGPPGGLDEPAQLVDRRRPEDRRGVADEVLPELARDLGDFGRRAESHQPLFEALRLERPGERLLDDEYDPVAAFAQDAADPDAVVGRPEGSLGEEHDRAACGHGGKDAIRRDPLAPIWSRIQAAMSAATCGPSGSLRVS